MIRTILLFSTTVMITYGLPACTSCPPGGIWSRWNDSSSCSATCGLYGTKSQTRICITASLGCPCTGNASRTTACPVNPLCVGAAASQCKSPFQKYVNFLTKRYECGNVTSADDDVTPTCTMPGTACGFCTSSSPTLALVTDGSIGNTAFDGDTITTDSNGCSVRTFSCISTAPGGPWPSLITVNSGEVLAESPDGMSTSTASIICNSDGTLWNYTAGGVTANITRIGCTAVNSDTYPGLVCGSSCTSSSPTLALVTDGSIGNAAFAGDTVTTDGNGCAVRTFTCVSTAPDGPWPSLITVNTGETVTESPDGSSTSTATIICNFDGTAWTYGIGGVTANITRIGCTAVNCATYPSVC